MIAVYILANFIVLIKIIDLRGNLRRTSKSKDQLASVKPKLEKGNRAGEIKYIVKNLRKLF
jgi:hypothetical protein